MKGQAIMMKLYTRPFASDDALVAYYERRYSPTGLEMVRRMAWERHEYHIDNVEWEQRDYIHLRQAFPRVPIAGIPV